MPDKITIIPYGSLKNETGADLSGKRVEPIAHRQPLSQFLEAIGISGKRIQLAMVNHARAAVDARTGDRVALFPKEYPIFVDWHAFRHASA